MDREHIVAVERLLLNTLRRSTAAFFLSLTFFWVQIPALEIQAARAQAQDRTAAEEGGGGAEGSTVNDERLANPLLGDAELAIVTSAASTIRAVSSPNRRIELDGVDREQFNAYLKIERYLTIQGTRTGDTVSVKDLPKSLQDELGIDRLSVYDRRILRSIVNEVTARASNGAGHEFLRVGRLTKDHRTEARRLDTETVVPDEDEQRESQHYRENGKAVDVTELGYLRGTNFTIESEVDEKGKPVLKDGKPVEKVIAIDHLPAEGIKFLWQSDDAANLPGALPDIFGNSPHEAGQRAAENLTKSALKEEAEKHGAELGDIDLKGVNDIASLSYEGGRAALAETNELPIALGRHAPLEIAQHDLAQQLGLSELSLRGKAMEGAQSLPYYAGGEEVSRALGLTGAVDGANSTDVKQNIGERVFEEALGNLPLGTLNEVKDGDVQSLKIAVGRGVIAKNTTLWVSDLLKITSFADLKARNPTLAGHWQVTPKLYDNLFGLSGGQTEAFVNGQLNWDAYLAEIGSRRLKLLEQYARKDTALNVTEPGRLVGKTADEFIGFLQTAERGIVDLFLAANTGIFVRVGLEHIVKTGAKDNEERQALRSYLQTGVMPTIPGTNLPAVNLDQVAGTLGFRSRIGFDAVFRTNGVAPALEAIGRLRLVEALVRDAQSAADGVTAATADGATLTARLDGLRSTLEAAYRQAPRDQRDAISQAMTTVDQLKVVVDQVNYLDDVENSEDWVNGATQIYETVNRLAGSPFGSSAEYRDVTLAVGKLADGNTGEALYAIKDRIRVSSPAGQVAINEIIDIIAERQTPEAGLKAFGSYAIDGVLGTKPGVARLAYEALDAIIDDSRPPTEGELRDALTRFARDHETELVEQAESLGLIAYATDLDGQPLSADAKQEALATAMMALLTQPTPAYLKHGADELSTSLGIAGYGIGTGEGIYGAITSETGGAVERVLKDAMADAKTMELLTGRLNLRMTSELRNKKLLSAMITYGADELGIPITPAMFLDPNYVFDEDEALSILNWAAHTQGTTVEGFIAGLDVPIASDVLANPTILKSIISGKIFDTTSEVWADGSFAAALDAAAAKRGVPPGFVRALVDKRLSEDERQAALKGSFRTYLTTQLNAERMNEIFGLEGTDAALTAQGVAGLVNIFLDDNITDKEGAFRELGLSIGDAYFSANYGFQISWMFGDDSIEEKGRLGLRTLSSAVGLDPAITEIADTFYEVLLLDGKLDLESTDGKANVAKLVTSFGTAAGVPGEYTVLASAALTGDLETTLVTFAGQSYIDRELASVGITDIGFTDIYEAFVAPLPETKARAYADAYEFMEDEIAAGSVVGTGEFLKERPQPSAFGGVPTTELDAPDGSKVLVWQNEADFVKVMAKQREQELRQERQRTIQYAATDALLAKALDGAVSGANLRGFTKAMMEGTPSDQLRAFEGLLVQVAGSSDAALILGSAQLAQDLSNFFGSDRDLEKVKPETFRQFDGWLAQATGWEMPQGTTEALFAFMKTGNTGTDVIAPDGRVVAKSFDSLLQSDYTKFQLSGYLDNAVGLPKGTTFTIWRSYDQYQKANVAYKAAQAAAMTQNAELVASLAKTNESVNALQGAVAGAITKNPATGAAIGSAGGSMTGAVAGAAAGAVAGAVNYIGSAADLAKNPEMINHVKTLSDSTKKAADANAIAAQKLTDLNLTMAGIVSTGVNLIFGKSLAKFDAQLGLPSGTASMLVTAAIYAVMVPGMTFVALFATVLGPALAAMAIGSLLSGNGILGIGGKKKTQKVKRNEILWSYTVSDPGILLTPIDPETGDYAVLSTKEREARTNLLYKKMTELYKAKPEEQRNLYTPKPLSELDRGDWPEEAWYPDAKQNKANPERDPANVVIAHPGVEIAFVKDEQLPAGVFRGNTKEQFLAGAKGAAQTKIIALVDDLIGLPDRLGDTNDEHLPAQIWVHDEAHLRANEGKINAAYGEGEIGSYQENLDDGQRKGVGYDEELPLLTGHVHWQY